jgi:hypothetical protein
MGLDCAKFVFVGVIKIKAVKIIKNSKGARGKTPWLC